MFMNKIVVVGAGYWGKNLVRNFKALGVLHGICDRNKENPNLADYTDVRRFTHISECLQDPQVEAIAIATPAELHFTMVREALLAGKHVFVEKPICLNETEGRELNRIAADNNLTLMVGHLLQYHPAFIKLREIVAAGEIGRIQYIYSNRLNLGKIRREENILWSFAPHDISMILSLVGDMPCKVSTSGGNYLHEHIADVTLSSLTFSNGVRAHIFVSWLHPYKEQKLIVVGDKGMLVFDDTVGPEEKLLLFPHHIDWEDGTIPRPVKENASPVAFEWKEPLLEECRHFVECMARGARPRTDGDEGLRVLRVLNALQQSLERSGAVQTLDEPGKKPYFAHATSVVDEPVEIGEGCRIWHFSHILKGSRVGKNCRIGQNVVIGPDTVIGNNVKIQNNVSVYKGVTLEDDVFCGPSMVFTNVHNPRSAIPRMGELRETLVKRGATIGANATVICGNTIGRYAFVGAGAVVTRSVPDYAIVTGNPAVHTGWICRCGVRLEEQGHSFGCPACDSAYERSAGGLAPKATRIPAGETEN